jgi:toxin YoeB
LGLAKKGKTLIPRKGAHDAVFHPEFREDLRYWVEVNRQVALRVFDLIEAIL